MTIYKDLSVRRLEILLDTFGLANKLPPEVFLNDITIVAESLQFERHDNKTDILFVIQEESIQYDDEGYDEYEYRDKIIAGYTFDKDDIIDMILDWNSIHIYKMNYDRLYKL